MSEKQIKVNELDKSRRIRPEILLTQRSIQETLRESGAQPPELRLKDKSTFQLQDMLFIGAADWAERDQAKLNEAINLATFLHEGAMYKGEPYVKHPLRVSNRLMHYLDIKDPAVINGGLLHDGVEDGAEKLVRMYYQRRNLRREDYNLSPADMQRIALLELEQTFDKRTSDIVASVTNPPSEEKPMDYDDWLAAYAKKVESGIETIEGFLVKVSDWCEHGPGIVHSETKEGKPSDHFLRKYGLVQPIYEKRFNQPDAQRYLGQTGKKYLSHQFALGRQRLLIPA